MASVLVRLQEVSRYFGQAGDPVRAVDKVSLDIPEGVFFALVGRSGSGKTTLLNLIGGLDRPTSGRIEFAGQEISSLPESALTDLRRRAVSFVFQSFGLLTLLSAYENVELPLRIAGVTKAERTERVHRALALVGLTNRAGHRPYELSGGEQQRVAIARALVTKPRLIIADEPTGELDSRTGAAVLDLFAEVVRTQGVTVLIATHDRTIYDHTTHIVEMESGRIQAPGALAEAARQEKEALSQTIFGAGR